MTTIVSTPKAITPAAEETIEKIRLEPFTGGKSWNSPDLYPEKPPFRSGWGGFDSGIAQGCSFEELRSYVAHDSRKAIKLVWWPGSERMVPPEEVPDLFGDTLHRARLSTRSNMRQAALRSVYWLGIAAYNAFISSTRSSSGLIEFVVLIVAFGIIPALQSAWELRRLRSYTWEDSLAAGGQARYQEWLGRRRAPLTLSFIGAIFAVGFMQVLIGIAHVFTNTSAPARRTWSAVDAAGLDKNAVWHGEVWRLLTGPMVHANIWHFGFNIVAVYLFGRVVEELVGRSYLAIVLILSTLPH